MLVSLFIIVFPAALFVGFFAATLAVCHYVRRQKNQREWGEISKRTRADAIRAGNLNYNYAVRKAYESYKVDLDERYSDPIGPCYPTFY